MSIQLSASATITANSGGVLIKMSYKADLKHFEAPSIDTDLGRLNAEQIDAQIKFTDSANAAYAYVRKNGFPEGYEDAKQFYDKNIKNADVNLEELYALDQTVSRTIWDADVFSQMGIPTSVQAVPKFAIKDYLVQSNEWPRFTENFSNPIFIHLKHSHAFTNGIGIHMGISIPFTEIAESAGALWGPQAIMPQELGAKMGLQKSRRGFLGTSCLNAFGDDGSDASSYGIEGLFNHTGNQTFESGAAGDDDAKSAGDIEIDVRVALTDLKKVYQPGQFYIVSTSGYASEMYLHRDTYQQELDSTRVKEVLSIVRDLQRAGQWGGWWVTEQLYAGTPGVANQQCMVFKSSPSLMMRHLIYPQQTLSMANKKYENDVQENHIFADAIQIKNVDTTNNAVPITIAADITCSTTGFIPDGTRIM